MTYFAEIPDDGVVGFMNVLMFSIQGGRLSSKVHLFQNDFVPTRSSTVASFVESTAGGMASQPLSTPASWGFDTDHREIWFFPQTIFTATGPGLPAALYGYWVDFTDPMTATKRVLWYQRFNNPRAAVAAGNTVKFVMSVGGKQC